MRDRDDYERFLRELEEDKELRSNINVFKKGLFFFLLLYRFIISLTPLSTHPQHTDPDAQSETMTDSEMTDGEEDDAPEIPLDELLDNLSIRDVAVGSDLNLPSSAFE